MEATVRKVRPDDAEAVVALQRTLFPGDPNAIEDRECSGGSIVGRSDLLVSEVSGAITGFAALRERRWRPWTSLDFLGVVESARGQGTADALLQAALQICRRPVLRLFVRPSNIAATKLYSRHGFWTAGARRSSYEDGEDALILMRRASFSRNNIE